MKANYASATITPITNIEQQSPQVDVTYINTKPFYKGDNNQQHRGNHVNNNQNNHNFKSSYQSTSLFNGQGGHNQGTTGQQNTWN